MESFAHAGDLGGKAAGLIRLVELGACSAIFVHPMFFSTSPQSEWNAFVADPTVKKVEHAMRFPRLMWTIPFFPPCTRDKSFPKGTLFAIEVQCSVKTGRTPFAGQLRASCFRGGKLYWIPYENAGVPPISRVLAYRERAGLRPAIRVAVVVQMVFSEVAGVLFTAHPQTVIEAECCLAFRSVGAGEGLFLDRVTQINRVGKRERRMSYTIADKDRMVVRAKGAGVEESMFPIS